MHLRFCLSLVALLPSSALAAAKDALPVNLDQIGNPGLLKGNKDVSLPALNAAQRSALSRQGFVITPAT